MAAPARILSLNLGTQTIGLAEFKPAPHNGLVLTAYRQTELMADPAADASRIPQIRIAVREMMDAMGMKGGRVNYAISAQSVFTRFVKLPTVAEEKVDQIITFEAQQNVPFPIDEVVWDYQLVGEGGGSQMEVVLVAIKADMLDEINSAVSSAGLDTMVVDVAPMALYNAFRYNYSDVVDCSLLVDIGARTTNLVFVEPRKVFSRSIPIGGNTISAAIAKDFSEPFGAAEERKRRDGFVSLGGAYAEPSDPDISRVSKMIRNSMTRLHAEISRSISFYRSQQNGAQPVRVYLCGGSSSLPYMREFFQEKLQLPIEFLNPLRNVAVGNNLNPEEVGRNAHLLGELVGLSLRRVSDCPMELNLEPASVIKRHDLARRRPYLVATVACLLLSLGGWWLYFMKAASVKAAVLEKLDPKVTELKSYEDQFNRVRKEIAATQETAAPYLQAVADREFWVRVIDDLNARLPAEFIWITLMEPYGLTADGKTAAVVTTGDTTSSADLSGKGGIVGIRVKGLYLDNPKQANVIDEFLKNLSESPYLELNLANRSEVNPVRSTPNDTEWAYPYELRLKLKKPISAQ